MAQFVDHYAALGIKPEAVPCDIEMAYRVLMKNTLVIGNKRRERVQVAYDLLRDPVKRRIYDERHYRYRRIDALLEREGLVPQSVRDARARRASLHCVSTPERSKGRHTLLERIGIYTAGIVGSALLAIPVALGISNWRYNQDAEQNSIVLPEQKYNFTEAHYRDILRQAAKEQNIEFCLAQSVYETEYAGPFYVSETGAVGVMELMPRQGSYTTVHYDNYQKARKSKGRKYQGKSAEHWAQAYHNDLAIMANEFLKTRDYDGLFAKDPRFNPEWNIPEGVRELAVAYHHFEAKGHLNHDASLLAMAAYNGGIALVESGGEDHIPKATQGYVNYVVELWEMCKSKK